MRPPPRSGELTEVKVTERVEDGTGRIVNPAKLTGKLVLKNISANQAVRLIAGKIQYIDVQGQPIPFKGDRTAPTLSISSSYNASDRLDPGLTCARGAPKPAPARPSAPGVNVAKSTDVVQQRQHR